MLGRLARELRLLGLDVEYRRGIGGMQAYREARGHDRLLLTRNKRLGKMPGAYFVVAQVAPDQVTEVKEKFGRAAKEAPKPAVPEPTPKEKPFSRCLVCNEPLVKISRDQARPSVPFFIYQIHHEFTRCPKCKRVYWPGSHAKDMAQRAAPAQRHEGGRPGPGRPRRFGRRPRRNRNNPG